MFIGNYGFRALVLFNFEFLRITVAKAAVKHQIAVEYVYSMIGKCT